MSDKPLEPSQDDRRSKDVATVQADVNAKTMQSILTTVGEAVYNWTVATDELKWGVNASEVLKGADGGQLQTGQGFAGLIDAAMSNARYDAVIGSLATDKGHGVPYQIEYAFCPQGRAKQQRLWVEECGRWFADDDGKPATAQGVIRIINERHERDKKLNYLSHYDELTGQMNRPHLIAVLEEKMLEAKAINQPFSFVMVAIENLALVNDGYGFDVADEVIAGVARVLRSCMRFGDVMGRVSGNKLGIILSKCDDEHMSLVAQRFQSTVRDQPIITTSGPVFVNLSMGGVVALRHALTVTQLMSRAHEALDVAKHKKRGLFVAYRASLLVEQTRRQNASIAHDVISALNERRLELAFQPILNVRTREPQFYEALLRMIRPNGTEVRAGEFMPTAEKLGLTRLIDHRVLELTVDALTKNPHVHLAMNVSARTTADPEWIGLLCALMTRKRELAARLMIEITESAAIDNLDETAKFIEQVKDMGCRVAIDDFGAGHSSFRYLRKLMVDVVKIDGSYIENISTSPDDQLFVKTLASLAQKLGLQIVAEWVQSEDDAQMLASWGIDLLQGFIYGEPSRFCFENEERKNASN